MMVPRRTLRALSPRGSSVASTAICRARQRHFELRFALGEPAGHRTGIGAVADNGGIQKVLEPRHAGQ